MRLFSMCERMKWAHLPVAGGIYDQHPQLLSEWQIIWEEKASYEASLEKNPKPKMNVKGR